jgi:multidrug efflux system membrane fusion protein
MGRPRRAAPPRFLTFGLALVSACSSGGGAVERRDQGPAVPVAVAAAVQRDAPVELRAIGNVRAYSTVSVKAQVEGQLARAYFTEGQEVKRDAPLFLIDPRPFEAAVRQAEANLARDQAQAAQARVDAERFARLVRESVASRQEYDQARTRARALEASVAADEAAVESARLQLQYCSIRSPIDGRVGQLLVHEGNVVKANETTLAVINQLRPVYVEFSVPQQDLPRIRTHMAEGPLPVQALPLDGARPPVPGELSFVNNTVDTSTGTVLLKAVLPNSDETLWPGQFVNVAVRLTTEKSAVMVPARAVQTGQQGKYVFVVRPDGTAELRPVVVGHTVDQDVVIQNGLAPGEQVVTEGQLRLGPGVRVEVKDAKG